MDQCVTLTQCALHFITVIHYITLYIILNLILTEVYNTHALINVISGVQIVGDSTTNSDMLLNVSILQDNLSSVHSCVTRSNIKQLTNIMDHIAFLLTNIIVLAIH